MPVRDAAGRPALEEMVAFRSLGGFDHASILSGSGPHEENQPPAFSDAGDDAACPSQVCCGHIQRDDMDTLPDAEYVLRVARVPM